VVEGLARMLEVAVVMAAIMAKMVEVVKFMVGGMLFVGWNWVLDGMICLVVCCGWLMLLLVRGKRRRGR
jgi:Na+(H+)/acetate symporter ActP